MRDLRSEPRKMVFGSAQLSWTTADGKKRSVAGVMEDRSASGMGIRIPGRIEIGTEVSIQLNRQSYHGTVVRCVRMGLENFIGVRILKSAFEIPSAASSGIVMITE